MVGLNDVWRYFSYQFDEDDLLLLQDHQDKKFTEYETKKADVFLERLLQCKKSVEEIIEDSCELEKACLGKIKSKLNLIQSSLQRYKASLSEDPDSSELKQLISNCLDVLIEVKPPRQKSRIIDLTDAGPGVGITNIEVKFRKIEEIRMMNYDYYVRHHLAPGDSSHNEVERIQSYVGDSVCDGGALNWEHRKKSDYLSDLDISNVTTARLEELEMERMRLNAFKVAHKVSERIDCAVAPEGFMKSFVSWEKQQLFFWDKVYLNDFFGKNHNAIVPGHNYVSKLEIFSGKHVIIGEKYLEFVKFACSDGADATSSSHCVGYGWVDGPCDRIPEPMPYTKSDNFRYLHINDTPAEIDGVRRPVNDFNPRVQLKNGFNKGI